MMILAEKDAVFEVNRIFSRFLLHFSSYSNYHSVRIVKNPNILHDCYKLATTKCAYSIAINRKISYVYDQINQPSDGYENQSDLRVRRRFSEALKFPMT